MRAGLETRMINWSGKRFSAGAKSEIFPIYTAVRAGSWCKDAFSFQIMLCFNL